MKKEYKNQYQDIFLKAERSNGNGGKKKGGSLGAVFKLIQELAEFEEKIEECADAQEMAENKEEIVAFIGQLDQMYKSLFKMAESGIRSMRSNRGNSVDDIGGDMGGEEEVEVKTEDIVKKPSDNIRPSLSVPMIPKM